MQIVWDFPCLDFEIFVSKNAALMRNRTTGFLPALKNVIHEVQQRLVFPETMPQLLTIIRRTSRQQFVFFRGTTSLAQCSSHENCSHVYGSSRQTGALFPEICATVALLRLSFFQCNANGDSSTSVALGMEAETFGMRISKSRPKIPKISA